MPCTDDAQAFAPLRGTRVLDFCSNLAGPSTRIIAALERRHLDPPLFPADPQARRAALVLAGYFEADRPTGHYNT